MDVAYDHVQEESLPDHEKTEGAGQATSQEHARSSDLNEEVREAYTSFTQSAWGAKLGGFWGSVKKQVSRT